MEQKYLNTRRLQSFLDFLSFITVNLIVLKSHNTVRTKRVKKKIPFEINFFVIIGWIRYKWEMEVSKKNVYCLFFDVVFVTSDLAHICMWDVDSVCVCAVFVLYVWMSVSVWRWVNVWLTCVLVHMRVCVYVCMCVREYVCMYICIGMYGVYVCGCVNLFNCAKQRGCVSSRLLLLLTQSVKTKSVNSCFTDFNQILTLPLFKIFLPKKKKSSTH